MEDISIEKKEENNDSWQFEVTIGKDVDSSTKHNVSVPKEYWKRITKEKIKPEELVRKSFEFLLEREPKESILKEFELPLIQRYFPEYEEEII